MTDANENLFAVPAASNGPNLPSYALDGRVLEWNADRSAVTFESSNEEYHSDHNAVSSAMLKVMARSPAHLRDYLLSQRKNKAAFVLGNAVHTAVLEPHLFASKYVVYTGSRLGNNLPWRAFKAANAHVGILNPAEFKIVQGMAKAVRNTVVFHNGARNFRMFDLINHGVAEKNIYWVDKETGLTCRMRYDLLVQNVMVDLKTTTDAREDVFGRDSMKFLYHVQTAHYVAGLNAFRPETATKHTVILLAAEKESPYATVAHKLDWVGFIDVGHAQMRDLLGKYRDCLTNNVWPTYGEPLDTLKLPQWYLNDHMIRPTIRRPQAGFAASSK